MLLCPKFLITALLFGQFLISEGHNKIIPQKYHPKISWHSRPLGSSNFSSSDLFLMLNKKTRLLITLEERIRSISSQTEISSELKLKLELLEVFKNELKATEKSLSMVLNDLNQTLSSDYRSLEKIKNSCFVRLSDIRDAAVLVEEDYNTIIELEKEMKALDPNTTLQTNYHVINDIFKDISHAADNLENSLHEHLFSYSKNSLGAEIETVIKVKEFPYKHGFFDIGKDQSSSLKHSEHHSQEGMSILIDSSSNQYVLSHHHDITVPIEDHNLIYDIVYLILLSFLLGGISSFFKVPSSFGYILAGTVLGPTGSNCIECVVQVETLGEVGVMLIVFVVGLEFTPEKLRKVWNIAVYGGNVLFVLSMLLAVLVGLLLRVHPAHSLFVAACLSLSSAPLAQRLIGDAGPDFKITGEMKVTASSKNLTLNSTSIPVQELAVDSDSDLTTPLAGLLVVQDIQLGLLVALMPFMNGSDSSWLFWVLQLIQVVFGFPLLLFLTRGLTSRLLQMFYRVLETTLNKSANLLLGSLAVCFLLFLVAEKFGASLELGCFLAGVAVSSQGSSADKVQQLVKPLRDLFAVFFFASLGFHVFPTFLKSEFITVCIVTLFIIFLKFSLTVLVLGLFLGTCQPSTWKLSLSLAQMSEFSFVLASRGRRLGIVSREVYLVILSTATLSLLLAPLLWHLFRVRVVKRVGPLSTLRSLLRLPRTITSRIRHSSGTLPHSK